MSADVLESLGTVRACLFVLAGEGFAVEVGCAREVVVLEDVTIVPRGPANLVGVTNLRGYVLPILDIRPLLGLPTRRVAAGTRVLVIEACSVRVAIAVDGVLGLRTFEETVPFEESAPRRYGELGVGLLRQEDGLVTLLDAAKVLQALGIRGKGE